MAAQLQFVLDCADPGALAGFWALALGYVEQPPPPGFATWDDFADRMGIPVEVRGDINAVVDPAGVGPRLLLQRVPEAKQGKNRAHIDVHVSGSDVAPEDRDRLRREHVERLVAAGAAVVEADLSLWGSVWTVMTDPEGNEFCVA